MSGPSEEFKERLSSLSNALQEACIESGMEVLGFVVLVKNDEADDTYSTETRARIPQDALNRLLLQYLAEEAKEKGVTL